MTSVREPITEFWEDCEKCSSPWGDDANVVYSHTCEGCRCRVWRGPSGIEYIMVWHGKARRNGPHELRGRHHTPENCKHWVSVDRSPEREREERERG